MNKTLLGAVVVLALHLQAAPVAGQGFTPEEAIKRMKLPEGFHAELIAAETTVRQPLSMTFDERGRLWVIQYLQYPNPAGLRPVKVDKYLRTVYDRVPEPPPKGPKGADRITILEDTNGDGHFDKSKDFVTGLNLSTGLAVGHGGVYIVQPPYLLFYPDKDGDDVPDGDPEVLLKGFGMEDSHAFANSLQWGPDGWLYGAQGSTVTASINGIEFQQGIWRFHPLTKKFELFSEGGGNTWGLDFDRHGNVIAGTNWGGKAMLHQVQGGYYVKGFGKHGPLHNPNTFGYFDHVPYTGFKGGHVTCGGIVYDGGAFPDEYNGKYIASNLLSNAIYWHVMEPDGSTFKAHFGGDFLVANDTWFRVVDGLVGPDGALYLADWYDKRANHVDPVDNWDKTNGRVYRISYHKGNDPAPPMKAFNLAKLSSAELVKLLEQRNAWMRREARRLLAERRDPQVLLALRKLIETSKDDLALEALWALYVSGGFDDKVGSFTLSHPNEWVRAWTVRLLGDEKKVSPALLEQMVKLAASDPSPHVRSQLACTAKRLPGPECLAIVARLLQRKEDVHDPFIPMLIWWAIEDKALSDRQAVIGLLQKPATWEQPMVRKYLAERIARRYMAEGNDDGLADCSKLLTLAPGAAESDLLIAGMEKALEGRRLDKVPPVLEKQLNELWEKQQGNINIIRFALRLGSLQAYDRALAIVADAKQQDATRASLIEVLGQAGKSECVPVLVSLLRDDKSAAVRQAALAALQAYPDPKIADTVLELYPKLPGNLKSQAQTLLCSRPAAAQAFLVAVDQKKIDPKEVPIEQLRQIMLLGKPELNKLIEKNWGKIGQTPPGEVQARIRSVVHILRTGKGNPLQGKELFKANCAICHVLFNEGNKIGPELTGADRKNTQLMVAHVVDPSALIRPEFVAHSLVTTDGRVLTGLIVESNATAVTLVTAKNERIVVSRDKIDDLFPVPTSLMPEKILDPLGDQKIRDLFAYLQGDGG
ncbi:MAG: PVC-type heme-binding CxxCH protein [Gemmataceae bacterium]